MFLQAEGKSCRIRKSWEPLPPSKTAKRLDSKVLFFPLIKHRCVHVIIRKKCRYKHCKTNFIAIINFGRATFEKCYRADVQGLDGVSVEDLGMGSLETWHGGL